MAKKDKKKHKKRSKKDKKKKRQVESIEDVSSESSTDLSSSSDSSDDGEDNSALTKAKAMLKFREYFQERLEQREKAAGLSKSNVKQLFDSSVPLDIEDLKAEFDNAPEPSLDGSDILRGAQQAPKSKRPVQKDLSNITIGKLPSKGLKPKPEKLVNQFFAKEIVTPKPKASIKIGPIISKIEKPVPEVPAESLPLGLEICPVTPPDGYTVTKLESKEDKSKPSPVEGEPKRSGPRIIHQVSEPDPEPLPVTEEEPEVPQPVVEEPPAVEDEEQPMEEEATEDATHQKNSAPLPAQYSSAPTTYTRPPAPTMPSMENTQLRGYEQAPMPNFNNVPPHFPPPFDPSKMPPRLPFDLSHLPPPPSQFLPNFNNNNIIHNSDNVDGSSKRVDEENPAPLDSSKPPTYDPTKPAGAFPFPKGPPNLPFPPPMPIIRPSSEQRLSFEKMPGNVPTNFNSSSRFPVPPPHMIPKPPYPLPSFEQRFFRPSTPENVRHDSHENMKVDRRPYDNMKDDRRPYDNMKDDRRPYDNMKDDRRPYDNMKDDRRPYDNMKDDRRPYDNMKDDRRTYDNMKDDRRSFDIKKDDRRTYDNMKDDRRSYDNMKDDRRTYDDMKDDRRKFDNLTNGFHPQRHDEKAPPESKSKSPTTPEIDPRAVKEALRLLQGNSHNLDDDVVRRALVSIKEKQKTEIREYQRQYTSEPTHYNYKKEADKAVKAEDIMPEEAEKILEQMRKKEKLEKQRQFEKQLDPIVIEEKKEDLEESSVLITGPDIPTTGLPEPDRTPAINLDQSDWKLVNIETKEDEVGSYIFPPHQLKDFSEYSDYYMHYYQQAYSMQEEKRPLESRYPVSQGYGHKRALEKGGTVKGSGRAVLFNKEEIQDLVMKRKKIAQEMVKDPSSSELMDKMEGVQRTVCPMFTNRFLYEPKHNPPGSTLLNECGVTETEIAMMETSQMQNAWKRRRLEDANCPAWSRTDMFMGLPKVRSTFGLKILKKIGWVPGQMLGVGCPYGSAFGMGSITPLEFEIKTDQAGLLSAEEKAAQKSKKYSDVMPNVITTALPAPRETLSGKHPIIALAEVCSKRKWKQPEYSLIKEETINKRKIFHFQVIVKGTKYVSHNGGTSKRKAKQEAAQVCLEKLGLMTSKVPNHYI